MELGLLEPGGITPATFNQPFESKDMMSLPSIHELCSTVGCCNSVNYSPSRIKKGGFYYAAGEFVDDLIFAEDVIEKYAITALQKYNEELQDLRASVLDLEEENDELEEKLKETMRAVDRAKLDASEKGLEIKRLNELYDQKVKSMESANKLGQEFQIMIEHCEKLHAQSEEAFQKEKYNWSLEKKRLDECNQQSMQKIQELETAYAELQKDKAMIMEGWRQSNKHDHQKTREISELRDECAAVKEKCDNAEKNCGDALRELQNARCDITQLRGELQRYKEDTAKLEREVGEREEKYRRKLRDHRELQSKYHALSERHQRLKLAETLRLDATCQTESEPNKLTIVSAMQTDPLTTLRKPYSAPIYRLLTSVTNCEMSGSDSDVAWMESTALQSAEAMIEQLRSRNFHLLGECSAQNDLLTQSSQRIEELQRQLEDARQQDRDAQCEHANVIRDLYWQLAYRPHALLNTKNTPVRTMDAQSSDPSLTSEGTSSPTPPHMEKLLLDVLNYTHQLERDNKQLKTALSDTKCHRESESTPPLPLL